MARARILLISRFQTICLLTITCELWFAGAIFIRVEWEEMNRKVKVLSFKLFCQLLLVLDSVALTKVLANKCAF